MAAHDDEVELLLGVGGNFLTGFADEHHFLRLHIRLFKERTHGVDHFFEALLFRSVDFFRCHRGKTEAQFGHGGVGDVGGDGNEVELGGTAEKGLLLQDKLHRGLTVGGTVYADAHFERIGFRGGFAAQNQNRVLRAGENAVGDGSQEEPFERGTTAAAHDDEVGAERFGFLRNHFRGITLNDLFFRGDVVLLEELAGRLQKLFRFFVKVGLDAVGRQKLHGTGGQRLLNEKQPDRGFLAEKRGTGRHEFE